MNITFNNKIKSIRYLHINPKIEFKPKNLNPFLANLSELYKGYKNEGLDVVNDDEIIVNMEDFEEFNKIDNIYKLNKLVDFVIFLRGTLYYENICNKLIYNINYLQLKECINILTKNNIIVI